MMSGDLVPALVTGILGLGGGGAGVSLWVAKKKTPVEVDNLSISGATSAVVALNTALAAETKRADRAERENVQLRARLAEAEQKLSAAEAKLAEAHLQLAEVSGSLAEIRQQLPHPRPASEK